jgi:hypothetical protein
MYSGATEALAPYQLIYAVWKVSGIRGFPKTPHQETTRQRSPRTSTLQCSSHLAGYAQQDSHEFFIALLDGLHRHLTSTSGENGTLHGEQALLSRLLPFSRSPFAPILPFPSYSLPQRSLLIQRGTTTASASSTAFSRGDCSPTLAAQPVTTSRLPLTLSGIYRSASGVYGGLTLTMREVSRIPTGGIESPLASWPHGSFSTPQRAG